MIIQCPVAEVVVAAIRARAAHVAESVFIHTGPVCIADIRICVARPPGAPIHPIETIARREANRLVLRRRRRGGGRPGVMRMASC